MIRAKTTVLEADFDRQSNVKWKPRKVTCCDALRDVSHTVLALPSHWLVLGWRPSLFRLEAIASRLEAIAIRLEAKASRLQAIAIRLESIAIRLEAMAT